ncbi:ubiquitin/ISG15-conjugating enzyme E2 L6 isoform X2 [Equus przewalskii]|uniref:Ubiquitin/ISG15-conjugating enzyme E2 L6 isoform X2 n=1 Tax=Equus przewalskii TaxID=9798 RepID=A0ABM2FFB4_EQUPR|nr:ubiquitin/ISG15-conjugating enzyme E2 L6 isoform X1 [Equus caballus]XP_008529330.1 PREDICTED: ubiquitin/ISG15-conjugating enzyme E2 L6 isoform X1 [Equus przewalskii]
MPRWTWRCPAELEDLQKQLPRYLRDLFSDDADVLVWHALLLPEKPPYNLKAFKLRINFPEEYPFRPPTVKFTTKIYHPNVDSDGQVCLPIISNENWKPCTKTCQGLPDSWNEHDLRELSHTRTCPRLCEDFGKIWKPEATVLHPPSLAFDISGKKTRLSQGNKAGEACFLGCRGL